LIEDTEVSHDGCVIAERKRIVWVRHGNRSQFSADQIESNRRAVPEEFRPLPVPMRQRKGAGGTQIPNLGESFGMILEP